MMNAKVLVDKWTFKLTSRVVLVLNGGSGLDFVSFSFGDPIESSSIPVPIPPSGQDGIHFGGWFLDSACTIPLVNGQVFDGAFRELYAMWVATDWVHGTWWENVVTSSSSNKETGIYSATKLNSSDDIKVDWGDGTVDTFTGDITQAVHAYASTGTYTVKVSNDVSAFSLCASNSTYYNRNRYNLTRFLQTGTNVTTLGVDCFRHCDAMVWCDIGDSVTSIENTAFSGTAALKDLWFRRKTAPTLGQTNVFGSSTSTYTGTQYTGYTNRSNGTNKLHLPSGHSGYTTDGWTVLTDANHGFTIQTF